MYIRGELPGLADLLLARAYINMTADGSILRQGDLGDDGPRSLSEAIISAAWEMLGLVPAEDTRAAEGLRAVIMTRGEFARVGRDIDALMMKLIRAGWSVSRSSDGPGVEAVPPKVALKPVSPEIAGLEGVGTIRLYEVRGTGKEERITDCEVAVWP